jgi:hypothetical protein
MISLSTLAKRIEDSLNEQGRTTGFKFKIATETGEFKTSVREKNDVYTYVNGLITAGPSNVTDLTSTGGAGLLYATQTCYLRLVVGLEDTEEDYTFGETISGYQSRLDSLRNTLNSVFEHNDYDVIEDGDTNYAVTTIYSFEQTGTREQLPGLGDCMSFNADIYFMFVENGINSRDINCVIDGVKIPFQSIITFRVPTMEGNVYANTKDGSTKNLVSQTTFSVTIELPAIKDETTESIINYLLKGNTDTHLLTYEENGIKKDALVMFGEVKASGETIKNIGQTITLMESSDDYDLISFSNKLYIYRAIMNITSADVLHDYLPKNQCWKFGAETELVDDNTSIYVGDYIVTPFEAQEKLISSGVLVRV